MGRDIWGVKVNSSSSQETFCIQCANRKYFNATKAIRDIDKILNSPSGKPDVFKLVCASPVSAKARDIVKKHAEERGIKSCIIWSGSEFEEHLRSQCEALLARFVNGVSFPDSAEEIKRFVCDPQVPCNLPYPLSPFFIQPGTAWDALNSALARRKPVTTRQVIVLHGLHGTGKTQAAIAKGWELRADSSAVLWVKGDSIEALKESFGHLCASRGLDLSEQKELEFEKRFSAVQRWLKEHSGWLLIVDNVDDREVRKRVLEWIAPAFEGILLITSRLNDWPPICTRIEFQSWERSLCVDFLKTRLRLSENDRPLSSEIADTLGGLPIALEQAAAFMEQTRTTIEAYLPKLRDDLKRELERGSPGLTDYPASFAVVLKHSLLRLNPGALFFLKIASFLAPKGQFLKIYETIAANSASEKAKNFGVQCPLTDVETDIGELNRWSLVRQRGVEFDVHQLVQFIVRKSLLETERTQCLATLGLFFFSPFGRLVDPNNSQYWDIWWAVLPHMEAFIHHTREGGDPRALGYLLNQMGLFLESQGFHGEAIAALAEAIQVAESIAGPEHPDTAAALNNLAELLISVGSAAKAKPLLLSAIAIVEKNKPLVPHAESSCWNNLGLCHKALGEQESAEAAFRKSLALDAARDANDEDISLIHQNNLAMLLDDVPDKREEAEHLYRNIVAKVKDEVRLATTLTNLGALLYRTGRASEAIVMLEKAVALLLKYFPPTHPEIKLTANHLAVARKKISADRSFTSR
jgi:tetratricopeptide (TPR) repeat protein